MSGGPDARTLAFYDANAADYADWSGPASPRGYLRKFISLLPEGGAALDFGCGSGWAAAEMRDAGLRVRAVDGAAKLAAEAKARHGIAVETTTFDAFEADAEFDGVWASFSLLHLPRAAMPGTLAKLRRALKPGGLLYVGLKGGEGDTRDRLGRFYALYGAEEIRRLVAAAGFRDIDLRERSASGYDGAESPILHLFARAPEEPADG